MISLAVVLQYLSVTYEQIDEGQTDRHRPSASTRLRIASRGKNYFQFLSNCRTTSLFL